MAFTIPLQLLALSISGDLGGLTIYTDRHGRKVAFPKSPPTKPLTALQLVYRNRFSQAMNLWKALPIVDRRNYRLAADRLCLCMLGHNLWLSLTLDPDLELWRTLCRQSHLPLAQPGVL